MTPLMMFLLRFCALTVVGPLLSMEGKRDPRFHQNILICDPKMNEGLERGEGE